ncbi:hypothetical protein ONZ43_g34 [Nemania bipapillata]|uniref:Uncharacterized protein n=1 Tax=Nemania bipapillata TaxID=110536 RepID=A0ACC2J9U8_9PEZI|nr:hypothetical protein ONZ43_g34 [Nemania bipapillata]
MIMATPTFMGLPAELLDEIIQHSLPEGFQDLAVTCKKLYALCKRHIEYHKRLAETFRCFSYRSSGYTEGGTAPSISLAFELIARIAKNPRVAHYIVHANLTSDDWPHYPRILRDMPSPDYGGPVVALFARSPHLAEAGLDWKEFYAQIREDHDPYAHYSQRAAAFLLTLLPNVRTLLLPINWEPEEDTNKLLEVVVRRAKQPNSPWKRQSLSQVTGFDPYCRKAVGSPPVDLNQSLPFLALPNVRSFSGNSILLTSDTFMLQAPKDPYLRYGEGLKTINLEGCYFDAVGIAELLKHTPRLRVLRYSHPARWEPPDQDWDLCNFVSAIGREVGSHLEELCISISGLRGAVQPGRASMRGFQRLRGLRLPLEFAACNIREANGCPAECDIEPFICDLVPPSVSVLSLESIGGEQCTIALRTMFRNLATIKDSKLPALTTICIDWLGDSRLAYEYGKVCEVFAPEIEKAGVQLYFDPLPTLRNYHT